MSESTNSTEMFSMRMDSDTREALERLAQITGIQNQSAVIRFLILREDKALALAASIQPAKPVAAKANSK